MMFQIIAIQLVDLDQYFIKHGFIFRILLQYDCVSDERAGQGGEYSVQLGFGWTNGVTLDLIHVMLLNDD